MSTKLSSAYELRLENTKALLRQSGLSRKDFAEKIGVDYGQLSHYIGKTPIKNIGDTVARRIENAFDLAEGYLDQNFALKNSSAAKLQIVADDSDKVSNIIHHTASPIIVSKQEFGKDYIWLDVVNASFSCGDGVSIEYHFDEVRDSIPFPPEFFIRKQVKPENTKLLVASGDSMEDYIYDQDLFAIDVTSTEILDGQIYAVYFEGEGMLKQIFKEEGGNLILHSLNPKYRDRRVTELNGTNFKVMGRQYWRAG